MYKELTNHQLATEYNKIKKIYSNYKKQRLSLDMSRGKPSPDQLSLSNGMLKTLYDDSYYDSYGLDCRNYGGLDGLPEMKQIFADILEVSPEEVIVGGNSSLAMMFENIAANMTHGVRDGVPWSRQGRVKFLCPVPGYDRHFSMCDYFHIEMIPIKLLDTGPDMDIVERLVRYDPMIKGMWCNPIYSNPDGITYSEETVLRLANLDTAAADFRLYWDNAYAIHNLYNDEAKIPNILYECEKAGNPHMPLIFLSFSKISFSGAAVCMLSSSKSNVEYINNRIAVQTIGPDKLNQLRHVKFFKNAENVKEHMKLHAAILRPKFEKLLEILDRELGNLEICRYTRPKGGYFISFYAEKGCAKKIIKLCNDAGVKLTDAGATYPSGFDFDDSNIRLAPSYPSIEDLTQAAEVFCASVKLATLSKLLYDRVPQC